MSKKKIKSSEQDLFNVPYGDKTINATLVIEFPLYLKNEKETIIWRYHEDGRYECFTFGKNSNSFTYGRNEYWIDSDNLFDKVFMVCQVRNNIKISEEEFLEKTSSFFNRHTEFLSSYAPASDDKEQNNKLANEQNDIVINNSLKEDF